MSVVKSHLEQLEVIDRERRVGLLERLAEGVGCHGRR
jgi:hypothetical protein